MPNVSAAPARLPHLGVLRFSGSDALSFLQGQISNDAQRLAHGKPLFAAYSTAQGRVLALIYLLPHSSGVAAILPREILDPTMERMRKFVMRAKVRIEDAGDSLVVAGRFSSSPETLDSYAEHEGTGMASVGHDPSREWSIAPSSSIAAVDAEQERQFETAWRLADIRAGLPQIYAATSETFVAQMLNVDLLDGISFTKGCYTGQEIIARTQHLGRIKRRLHRLQLPEGVWNIGQAVRLSDGRQGRLTEVIESEGRIEALAVLNLERNTLADGEESNAIAADAVELPLPYPLFRAHVRE
jgi:folate-binding protein YgfZ